MGQLAAVTDDYAEAARGSGLIFVFAPATFQTEILVRALDGLSPEQVVCFAAGTFSCWPAARALAEAGGPDVTFAEMATLPYGVRVAGPATVRFALSAAHLPTGVFPAARTEDAVARLREAYPAVEPVEDSLAAGLLNFDGALHAPLTLMNAGAIEGMTAFDVHVQGATPAVIRVSLALDAERIAIREALGYHTHHWPLLDYYEGREMFYGVAYRQTRDRSVWNERIDFSHRYVTEDVALGLVLWSSLGRRLGVPTPLSGAFVAIASMINGADYIHEGRTLERLGLADVSPDVLRAGCSTAAACDRVRRPAARHVPDGPIFSPRTSGRDARVHRVNGA